MSKELIVSATRHETRLAVLEDDQVTEVFYQRENEYSLAGSIHKGRVTRVLPGMQSAFVDIGLDRDAFLYVSDFFEDNDEYEKIVSVVEDKILKLDKGESVASPDQAPAELGDEAQPVQTAAPAAMAQPVQSGAPPSQHAPGGEGREGRGRRSRRRRPHGGRGLPESKYFSPRGPREGGQEQSAPERNAPERLVEAPRVSESVTDFAVLPGESLAKYGPGGRAPETEREERAPEPAPEPQAIEVEPLTTEDRIEPLPDPELAVEEPAVAVAIEPAVAEVQEVAVEADDPSEDSATEMQAMTDDGAAAPAENAEPATESASATVREQNPRFLHRVSRRMRRKMRGGDRGDGRGDGRPEMRSAPAVDAVRAPEARTEVKVEARPEPARGTARPEKSATPSISDLLKEGQEIIVQIAKEPLGQKGARITSHIALPGRYLVYMPTVDHIGVSRKIPSDEERSRLKRVLQTHRSGIPGWLYRAHRRRWPHRRRIARRHDVPVQPVARYPPESREAACAALLHHDLDLVERVLRDQFTSSFKSVWVDNEEVYERVLRFVERFQPAMVPRIKLYTRATPIFDEFNVTAGAGESAAS